MKKEISYIPAIIISILVISLFLNLISTTMWFSENGAPLITIIINGVILPISLLIMVNLINDKYGKDLWIMNFLLIIGFVSLSIYIGFLNWKSWVIRSSENNLFIDKGTYMILNLELLLSFCIIGLTFLIKITSKTLNIYRTNKHKNQNEKDANANGK